MAPLIRQVLSTVDAARSTNCYVCMYVCIYRFSKRRSSATLELFYHHGTIRDHPGSLCCWPQLQWRDWRHSLLMRVDKVQGPRDARGPQVFVDIFYVGTLRTKCSYILLSSVCISAFDPTPTFAGVYIMTIRLYHT